MSSRSPRKPLGLESLESRALLAGDLGVNFLGPPIRPPDPPVVVRPPCVPQPLPMPNGPANALAGIGNHNFPIPCPTEDLTVRALTALGDELGRINAALERVLATLGDPSTGVPDAVQAVLQRIHDKGASIEDQVADFLGDDEDPPVEGAAADANNRLMGDGRVRGTVIRLEMLARRLMAVDRTLAAILHRIGASNTNPEATPSDAVVEQLNRISAGAVQVQEQVAPFLNTTEDPNDDPGNPGNGMGDGNHLPGPGNVPRPGDPSNPGGNHTRPVVAHLSAVRAVVHRTGDALDGVLQRVGEPGGELDAAVKTALQKVSNNAQSIADTANGLLNGSNDPASSAAAINDRPPLPPTRPGALARHLTAIGLILDRAGHHLQRIAHVLADKPDLLEASRESLQAIATDAEEIVAAIAPYLADAPVDPAAG